MDGARTEVLSLSLSRFVGAYVGYYIWPHNISVWQLFKHTRATWCGVMWCTSPAEQNLFKSLLLIFVLEPLLSSGNNATHTLASERARTHTQTHIQPSFLKHNKPNYAITLIHAMHRRRERDIVESKAAHKYFIADHENKNEEQKVTHTPQQHHHHQH